MISILIVLIGIFAHPGLPVAQYPEIAPSEVFAILNTYLGSSYINDFNLFERTFRLTAQADAPFHHQPTDILDLKTRSSSGAMIPIGSVATLTDQSGPYRVVRHNLHPAAELPGDTKPGFSPGQALKAMETLAAKTLQTGFGFEWTELAYQQKAQGNTAAIVFALAVEAQLASSRAALTTDQVAVFKALGGGWENAPETITSAKKPIKISRPYRNRCMPPSVSKG